MNRFSFPAGAVLALALAALVGCAGNPDLTGAAVSGTVRYKSAVLPGGTIRLVLLSDDTKSASGRIDMEGRYEVKNAPVGECKVLIETESAKNDPSKFMAKVPADVDRSKMPPPVKYVPIDKKYNDPASSPLRLTVEKGTANKDIEVP